MNLFLSRKLQSGLSYRAIARKMGITHAYAYRLIERPGASNNIKLVVRIGAAVGMSAHESRSEWLRLRVEYVVAKTRRQARV